jgi:hypothetical protein
VKEVVRVRIHVCGGVGECVGVCGCECECASVMWYGVLWCGMCETVRCSESDECEIESSKTTSSRGVRNGKKSVHTFGVVLASVKRMCCFPRARIVAVCHCI